MNCSKKSVSRAALLWLIILSPFIAWGQTSRPLLHSRQEVENVSRHFNGHSFFGDEATESQFKKSLGSHRILHLATHSEIDDENPLNSRLLLSKQSDSDEDGILFTHEIHNLPLQARLAVLSSCNTGVGKQVNGEGVMSLAHAFAMAGCPSVVMTLWQVDDRATSKLISHFYEHLQHHTSIDVALQKAKLDYIENHDKQLAAPFYWASFNAWGTVAPLQPENVSSPSQVRWLLWGAMGLSLLLAGFVWRKVVRK